jgi:hypothetical protein
VYAKFKETIMAKRRVAHEEKMLDFIADKGVELQN